ncbi:MAG: hypothetical protein MMC33_004836 [Icmadophila ericetorum]|nr:hypothetical protein [Icmadophila ericetorum]
MSVSKPARYGQPWRAGRRQGSENVVAQSFKLAGETIRQWRTCLTQECFDDPVVREGKEADDCPMFDSLTGATTISPATFQTCPVCQEDIIDDMVAADPEDDGNITQSLAV